jgi:hypothetical protein
MHALAIDQSILWLKLGYSSFYLDDKGVGFFSLSLSLPDWSLCSNDLSEKDKKMKIV